MGQLIQLRPKQQLVTNPAASYISASRLKLWLKCPMAWRLRYIDGIKTPSTPNLFLGTVVHAALEYFYTAKKRGVRLFPEVVADQIKAEWVLHTAAQGLLFGSKEEEDQLEQQAIALVREYIEQLPDDEPEPLGVEQKLTAPLIDPRTGAYLGIDLVGIVDLVLDGAGGPIIADFKTAARSSSAADVMHELQLSCYSYLLRHTTGRTESGIEIRSLIKTKRPKIEVARYAPRSDAHFNRLFAVIRAYIDAINSGQFHISPGFECGWCDYREMICAGGN